MNFALAAARRRGIHCPIDDTRLALEDEFRGTLDLYLLVARFLAAGFFVADFLVTGFFPAGGFAFGGASE